MAATASIRVVKTMTYRGVPRTFSNRYHLAGGTPPDSAHWTTLSDAIVAAEAPIYDSAVTITATFGYAAGSEVPVFSKTYSTAGSMAATTNRCPGDCAALVRYATAARSSKNHPVYLYNYYHSVFAAGNTAATVDNLYSVQATAMGTYAAAWIGAGFSDGATTYHRAGPNGATATGQLVEAKITHRDFPR